MTMLQHAVFILVLPLVTAAVIALFFRRKGDIDRAFEGFAKAGVAP